MFILKDKINKKVCKDLINIYENSDQKEMNHNTQHAIMNQVVLYANDEKLAPFIKELIKSQKLSKFYLYFHKEFKELTFPMKISTSLMPMPNFRGTVIDYFNLFGLDHDFPAKNKYLDIILFISWLE